MVEASAPDSMLSLKEHFRLEVDELMKSLCIGTIKYENYKKQILSNFLETIEGISNKEYQRRVWILGKGPKVDDFDETCCHFYSEGDSILENYKDFWIT